MTLYEIARICTFPLMPVHLQKVRTDLLKLVASKKPGYPKIIDVGGRKSPYTIGLPAKITITDLPRQSSTQENLNLGVTNALIESIKSQRSNIDEVIIQDMTRSNIKNCIYDAAICVEVIEHVSEDKLLIKNIASVIKENGWLYLTTPNGDYIKNEGPDKNPDHVRHYTKLELQALLKQHFNKVEVYYAVKTGKYRVWGLGSFNKRKPLRIFKSIAGNLVNRIQSKGLKNSKERTAHLVAVAYK